MDGMWFNLDLSVESDYIKLNMNEIANTAAISLNILRQLKDKCIFAVDVLH